MAELKPCPFCGGEATFSINATKSGNGQVGFEFSIRCSRCNATVPRAKQSVCLSMWADGSINLVDDGRGKAAAAWNERANDGT